MKLKTPDVNRRPYPSAKDVAEAEATLMAAQHMPSSLKLAFTDTEFLLSEKSRPVRIMLEMLKPEEILKAHHIEQTIVVFGSARIQDHEHAKARYEKAAHELRLDSNNKEKLNALNAAESLLRKTHYYDEARKFGRLVAEHFKDVDNECRFYIATGGGPGIMEAANRGASDVGVDNIGFTIALPREFPNVYSTPDLTFQFHYFAIRKMHLLMRARALVVFPGGFGTLDELFETLTLMQTYKIEPIPVLLFGREFWEKIVDFDALLEEAVVSESEMKHFTFVDSAEDAWSHIVRHYGLLVK